MLFNDFNHERIQKNSAFIGSNHRKEDEANLTSFYDETKQIPEMKHIKSNVKCCCIPITLYLYMQHSAQYRKKILSYGLNALARQWYQQSMERACDIYSGLDRYVSIKGNIMGDIWMWIMWHIGMVNKILNHIVAH
eukprot:706712_1